MRKVKTLTEATYHSLLESLMAGAYPPGQRLIISELGSVLGVSATPIREALAQLNSRGFVDHHSRRGYTVASALSSDQILQIMETRLLLEPKLAFEAATANTPALLSRLSVTLDEMQSAQSLNRDDSHFVQCWLADEHFHELIAAAAGKPYMERAYLSLGGQVQRFRILARSGCRQAQAAVEEHRAIFQELQSGDSNGAYVAMKHHLTQASARAVEDARAIEGAAALIGESGVA